MMIMRFHKLIQSKLLWLAFLGILICTFVLWGVAGNTESSNPALSRLNETYAVVGGEDISYLEFDQTRRLLERMNSIPRDALDEVTLNRLAMLSYAEELEIWVPEELARQQFAANFTTAEGEIDQELLTNFRNSLRGSTLTEEDYIRFIRDDMILQHLQQILSTYTLVTPEDVEHTGRLLVDELKVQYVTLSPDAVTEEIEVSENMVESYFSTNTQRFEIPEKRVVQYVHLPLDSFKDQIKAVTEEDARLHYQSRPEQYMRTVRAASEVEGEPPASTREPIPFDEVRERIITSLERQRALEKAREAAMSYAVKLTPRRGKQGLTLEQLAEEKGLEIRKAGPFGRRDSIPGISNSGAFKQNAFMLDDTSYGRVSSPVNAGDGVVVMVLDEVVPPRIPEMEEVAEQVRSSATNHYQRVELARLATNMVEEIKVTLTEGASFASIAEEKELDLMSPEPFQPMNLNPQMPVIPPPLVQQATLHAEGEVFGPVSHPYFGGQMIGYVDSRTPKPEQVAELSPRIRQSLMQSVWVPGFFTRFQEMVLADRIKLAEPKETGGKPESAEEPPSS